MNDRQIQLTAPVGHFDAGAINRQSDVILVQTLLIAAAEQTKNASIHPGGNNGRVVRPSGRSRTVAAIRNFQTLQLGYSTGVVEPDSPTWIALSPYLNIHQTNLEKSNDFCFAKELDPHEYDLRKHDLCHIENMIKDATEVESLTISDCALGGVPDGIRKLSRLRVLRMDNIGASAIPDWIGELAALEELSIAGNGLLDLPDSIKELRNLKILNLSRNSLIECPDQITTLDQLTRLEMRNNAITRCPTQLACHNVLERLDLGENALEDVSEVVWTLQCLKELSLDNNNLTKTSRAIACLKNLEVLHLDGNRIQEWPDDISTLTSLRDLYLSANSLGELPLSICSLLALQTLDIARNEIKTVPGEIGKLRALESLYLQENLLKDLPPEIGDLSSLSTLYLNDNLIRRLPQQLGHIHGMRVLNCDNNPIESPPPEVLGQGASGVSLFLRSIAESSQRVWKSKVICVGEGAVGKTSMRRLLSGGEFDPKEKLTHGIEVESIEMDHPSNDSVDMQITFWDFGGQQIYHATHQFFLSNRSLFVLAWNARTGYEQSKLFYWLDMISAKAPESPIIVVATHIDQSAPDLPEAKLMSQYPQIRSMWSVSNSTGEGVSELRDEIARLASQLPLMGETWPSKWIDAADAVGEIGGRQCSASRVFEVCDQIGLNDHETKALLRWLHELGTIVYFPDNEVLRRRVLLNPQWVNQQICCVLEDEKVQKNEGVLTSEDAARIWSENVDLEMREFFLGLMEEFDLSYRTMEDRDISLVPGLLGHVPPTSRNPWEMLESEPHRSREICMDFRLGSSIPAGIPAWFIARSNRFSIRNHWRLGTILADVPSNPIHLGLVEVSADPVNPVVSLKVRGPNPHFFFNVLRDGLEETFKRYSGLKIERKIPCPGHSGEACEYEFDFEHLEGALANGMNNLPCMRSFEPVSVSELLFGMSWRTDGDVIARLDCIQNEIGAVKRQSVNQIQLASDGLAELRELRSYVQREFVRNFRREQQHADSHCPQVFALRPTDEQKWLSKITGTQIFKLQLYCAAPGCWHPVDKGGCYEIEVHSEWLRKLAPYIGGMAKAIKHATPLIGASMGILNQELAEVIGRDIDLMNALAVSLPEIEDGLEIPELVRDKIIKASAESLRALRVMLDRCDPSQHWGGLKKVFTPEGDVLWVCADHEAELIWPSGKTKGWLNRVDGQKG